MSVRVLCGCVFVCACYVWLYVFVSVHAGHQM